MRDADPACLPSIDCAVLVSQFSRLAFRAARNAGVRLCLRTDFAVLAEVFAQNRPNWRRLFPVFDPAFHDLTPASAIWIQGLNDRGETISTYAARALHWPDTTLGEETTSLRLFFGDPGRATRGDYATIPAAPCMRIRGRTVCLGSLWVRPDHRGLGLTKIMSRLCKAYASAHWQVATGFGFTNPTHFATGVARAFGTVEVEHGLQLRLGGRDLPASLSYQSREALLADIACALRRGEIESSRRIETMLTNESLAERRQGMASR